MRLDMKSAFSDVAENNIRYYEQVKHTLKEEGVGWGSSNNFPPFVFSMFKRNNLIFSPLIMQIRLFPQCDLCIDC